MTATPLSDVALLLHPDDHVAVALHDLPPGRELTHGTLGFRVTAAIPQGHKLCVRPVRAGSAVHKYGQSIGRATTDVQPGDHVHTHNLAMDSVRQAYEFGTGRIRIPGAAVPRTFAGFDRAGGAAGTRNYVGIVTSVNCSASTARMIADQFRGPIMDAWPNVDGVVALTHDSGCGMVPASVGGQILRRTLRGYASHPNVGALLAVGLGCEMLAVDALLADLPAPADTLIDQLIIQEQGGVRATVRAGVAAVRTLIEQLDQRRRVPLPASRLILGLNCGGSDGYSGITANPALGHASDLLVAQGATTVLAETPEVFGAEHLLTRRAVSEEVGRRLLERIEWWQKYVADGGGTLDNNPSPGNKAGGLTTILEKSLGAVAKGGTAELTAVYEYAERVTAAGFTFMDTPGYDPVSVTGLVAGGATVVCFTTGRGSVLGTKPVPTIKIATNTEMYDRMREDMDLNAGVIATGDATVEEVGAQIFEQILAVASGRVTVSEDLDLGRDEFVPWQLGAVT
ncbi:putative D-galactarate dehydratase/altronate hydrolase [Actinoplanes missouriensis 431]|uniref:Putative D-galactarate dehydratase/altronate hydrolase n=1 Tax=Actinoplanes missouriensis (strain ATCC 14538 / DSM 43046 / CBS 188.64 / JCM 3121 / NBRC 102363 / NCIMB 12654 / NRRL B-3342 / UNCC 431) TaxID=512565 RepID=I0HA38_ACTM4|nr:altronate dehydratase family protein [Actinoplanes missouriensis]BAL89875.1 putative D-galactarate dehydratase/altronate hydrolase [Actinoplanes missouriensis 431]